MVLLIIVTVISIISIIGGIIAASSYIVSKKENAKELIAKIAPYQGFIAIVLITQSIFRGIRLLGLFSLGGIAITVVQFIVGLLLGYSLLSQYLFSKNDEVKEKAEELRAKLVPYQVPAGLTLIVLEVLRFFGFFY